MSDVRRFFASCALGAEELLRQEIESFRPFTLDVSGRPATADFRIVTTDQGGVEFEAAWEVGLALNHWLKLANRIWLRLASFPAKSPPRLQERLRSLNLKPYLGDRPFHFNVEAHHCALHNEKQLRRWAADIWKLDADSPFEVFLRGASDEWTISLDTSGEHLHKRGNRPHAGVAPLRETHAAFSLRVLLEGEPWAVRRRVTLLDPMTGAGTFLREARGLEAPVTGRDFVFRHFKNTPKILLSDAYFKNLNPEWRLEETKSWGDLVGGEIDPALAPIHRELIDARVLIGDSFARTMRADWGIQDDARLWIVLNPPYGERLAGLEWIERLGPWARGLGAEKLLLWCPEKLKSAVLKAMPWEPAFEQRMSNGGIPCAVMRWNWPV
ncbi:MAG: hypothetical protein KF767_13445 [Bdellovibrionaceae bacterium]|nr:hypothetical protein [Pseudobdellovibrionaceae bacterium]